MTVRYNREVATVKCGGFLRLLFRWEGSIYKLVWFEIFVFLGLYGTISLAYHFLMPESSKRIFEDIAQYCNKYSDLLPISFVLGFYVQRVISRFYEQFKAIPWPNRLAIYVSTYIHSNDERGRLTRRAIVRYIYLSFIMVMSSISPPVRKRFPTLTHMTEAGFLMPSEELMIVNTACKRNKYFVPLVWATAVVTNARREGNIKSDLAMQSLLAEIDTFRAGLAGVLSLDWITIPLGYTQVVTLAVHIFCLMCLFGRYQFAAGRPAENHLPFFTLLQFVFYMGWLKVAESGLNPFGSDDDDFDVNLLVDRFLHESYIIVDDMFMKTPDVLKDQHWNLVDFNLPYTPAAAAYKKDAFLGSAVGVEVPADKQAFVPLESSSSRTELTSPSGSWLARSVTTLRSRRKSQKTVADASDSKESVEVPGGVSSVRFMETTSIRLLDGATNALSQDDLSSISSSTSNVRRLSIAAGQQSRTSSGQQLSTSADRRPSTSADRRPSYSADRRPSTSADRRPSTAAGQQPSTSIEQQASISAGQLHTSTSAREQISTPTDQQPSTSVEQKPSTIITQQESNLMAKIQEELNKLRSENSQN